MEIASKPPQNQQIMEKREYIGKNIKLGWMHTFIPTMSGVIQGENIYIAKEDGLYYGLGGMEGAIWIQNLPWLPDETAELFLKGVELIDQYAPSGKWKTASKVLKALAKRNTKTGTDYCQKLNFFFDLGRYDGSKNPLDHIKDCMWKYRNYIN